MKHIHILMMALSGAALATGCKPEPTTPPTPSAQSYEQMKKETKEAAQATKDYAYAQKSEFVAAMKTELAQLDAEMDRLGQKIESSSSTAKEEAKAKLQVCRERSTELNKRLETVKDASENTWDEVKTGVKKGYEELKTSFDEARQWLSRKLAT